MRKLIFLIMIPFLFCCSKKQTQHKQYVRLAITAPIRSLDPRVSSETPCTQVIGMLFEGLMSLGPNGEILPGAADSYEISEDHCVYTFKLRDSVWSNGDPVTAQDFEYAWKKSVNPKTAHNGAFTFYCIKNVKKCLSGDVDVDQVGVQALDDKTLRVELEHPAPYFLALCTRSTFSPIHRGFAEKNSYWANTVNPEFVCNGPFKISNWKKGVEILFEKNPTFWNAKSVSISGIRISVNSSLLSMLLEFEKGELDWLGDPFNILPRDLIEEGKLQKIAHTVDGHGLFWFFLNTQAPPFNNKNFRKAIAYAIDRLSMTEYVFQFGEQPALGILNKGIAVSDASYFKDKDLEEARKHLKLALEETGMTLDELPPIQISQRNCLFTSRVTRALQEQLRDSLGITVKIEHADWPVHFVNVQKGEYQMGEMPWHSWLRDPIYMLDTFRDRETSINMSRWEHPRFKELLVLADNEVDTAVRKEYLLQAEELLMDEMPVIPICYTKYVFLCNPKLKGVYFSPLREIEMRYAHFE